MESIAKRVVLIVDDEASNIFALSSYLETLDADVRVARNGAEAIVTLQHDTKVDIILLDMMMPVMDGYETLAFLKNTESLNKIPVIAVTARAMKGDRERCLEAGAWDYISKPLDLRLLVEKIARWVQ
jgi:CheY-like chemotaxis protein